MKTPESAERVTSEDSFAILESMRQGVVLRDATLAVVYVNSAARQILGIASGTDIEPQALQSWQILDEYGQPAHLPIQLVVNEGRSWHGVLFKIVRPHLPAQWLESEARPFLFANGEVGALSIFVDVTASHVLRLKAEERERYFKAIAENANDLMWRNDEQARIVWIAPSVTRILGFEVDELIGTRMIDLIHPDDHDEALARRTEALDGKHSWAHVRIRRKDGSWCPMSVSASPFVESSGATRGTFSTARDVSVEDAARAELGKSENRYRLLNEVSDSLGSSSDTTRIAEIAAGFLARSVGDAGVVLLFDSAREKLVPMGVAHREPDAEQLLRTAIGEEPIAVVDGIARKVADQRLSMIVGIEELLGPNPAMAEKLADYIGHLGLASSIVAPLLVADEAIGVVALGRNASSPDFTTIDQQLVDDLAWRMATAMHRARLTESLSEAERLYRLIAEGASDVVVQLSLDGRHQWVSPSVSSAFGWDREEFLALHGSEITHPDDRVQAQARFEQVTASGSVHNRFRFLCKNGRYVWVDAALRLLNGVGGEPVAVVAGLRNIETEMRATEALAESEETFRLAMANAPIGMAVVALDGSFIEVNAALCAIVGLDREELLAQTFQDITYEADLGSDLEHLQRLLDGLIPSYRLEKRYRRGDGHLVWVELQVSLVRGAEGEPRFFVSQIVDIDEVRKARRLLEFRARHDALTGALDRAAFLDELGALLRPGEADAVAVL